MFGTELAIDTEYSISGKKLAVFTWHGCELEIKGTCAVEYNAGDTPMQSYLNVHVALEQMREDALEKRTDGLGPKV